ncbi:MAG: hypothetical protein IPJ65_00840 [Archangiaceae bacterium]|nr:hypothetical protein [Archangiaceae bacterium]
MSRFFAVAAFTFFSSCTSVQLARYPDGVEVASSSGKVKGVVQVNKSTVTLFLDYIDVVDVGLEGVTRIALDEARALGGKPQLISARVSPRGGWWALLCLVACVNSAEIVALSVEAPAGTPGETEAPTH